MTETTESNATPRAPEPNWPVSALRAIEEVACAPASLLLEICVDRAHEVQGATGAAVGLAREGELHFTATAGDLRGRLGGTQQVGGTLGGLALSTGEPLYTGDAQTDERCDQDIARNLGVRGMIAVPLIQGRRRVGVLWVCSSQADAFDVRALDLITRIGRVVSARLDYAQVRDERRRSEQALVESRLQQAALLAALDEGVVAFDASRRVVLVNAAAERILATPRERLLTSDTLALAARGGVLHEDGTPWTEDEQPVANAMRTGQPQRDQLMLVPQVDGPPRWLKLTAQPVFDPSGEALFGVVVTLTDVTAQREGSAPALNLDRPRAAPPTEPAIPSGYWDWHAGANVVNWSPGMYALLGLDPERTAPTFETYLGAAHPEDRPAVRETVLTTLREGGTYGLEHRVIRPDGEIRRVRASGEASQSGGRTERAWGSLTDVTETHTP